MPTGRTCTHSFSFFVVSVCCNVGFAFQFSSTVIIPEPQQIAVLIGHLARDTDLIAVEVAGLLTALIFFIGPVVYMCQGFMRTAQVLRRD